jgi:hypothetical protein
MIPGSPPDCDPEGGDYGMRIFNGIKAAARPPVSVSLAQGHALRILASHF